MALLFLHFYCPLLEFKTGHCPLFIWPGCKNVNKIIFFRVCGHFFWVLAHFLSPKVGSKIVAERDKKNQNVAFYMHFGPKGNKM